MPVIARHRWIGPLLSGAALGCGAQRESIGASALRLHPCVSWQTRELARCGTIEVPERHDVPGARVLRLAVMVLPARGSRVKPDPLVFFDGGPGLAATHAAAYASWALDKARIDRDLLLVDMRGTGDDAPLACHLYDGGRTAPYLGPMFPIDRVRACATRLRGRADVTRYSTEAAARDFDDVRAALRIDRVNLYGASYGSRLALQYMRRFPAHVRRAALLGVNPPEVPVGRGFDRHIQQAIDSGFAACAASARCRADAPDPRGDLVRLRARLERAPPDLRIWSWRRLSAEHVALTARAVDEWMWVESYDPLALPTAFRLIHHAVATGDVMPLVARMARVTRARREGRAEGLMLSILCSEDVPRLSDADTARGSTLLGAPVVHDLVDACAVWPRGQVAASFGARVVSSIPILLISGGRDPVTPPELADSAATTLSRSERYVNPGAGHAALDDDSRAKMATFFEADDRSPVRGSAPGQRADDKKGLTTVRHGVRELVVR
jgi:pimeloyl-ACP methyl ester carboxylesterase